MKQCFIRPSRYIFATSQEVFLCEEVHYWEQIDTESGNPQSPRKRIVQDLPEYRASLYALRESRIPVNPEFFASLILQRVVASFHEAEYSKFPRGRNEPREWESRLTRMDVCPQYRTGYLAQAGPFHCRQVARATDIRP